MGDRYILTILCPVCKTEDEAYYAPTCGFVDHECANCGEVIDLAEYTGISYEDASNAKEIEAICQGFQSSAHFEDWVET